MYNKPIIYSFFFFFIAFCVFVTAVHAQSAVEKTTRVGNAPTNGIIAPDGKHACPVIATYTPFKSYAAIASSQYSYVCGHCRPIYNAIDTGVNPAGGTEVVAIVDGKVTDNSNPVGGTALWLTGDDGKNYYYAHLKKEGLVTGSVKAGQVIGRIAAASENAVAKNNGIAHVHFSSGTPGNGQSFRDPANIPAGPLIDAWCGNNVCGGKPNTAYACG